MVLHLLRSSGVESATTEIIQPLDSCSVVVIKQT